MTVREKEEKGSSSNTKMAEFNNREPKKEEDINLQIGTSSSQVSINGESERCTKRSKITESDEAESTTNNEEEYDLSSELGQDPLLVAERIISKYYNFIDYLFQFLKNDEEKQDLKVQWQKWSEILDRGKILVKTLNRDLRVFSLEMECLEAHEDLEKQYHFRKAHIPNILNLLRNINSRIASSSNLRLVSDIKNRGKVLAMCLRELERSRQELIQLIGVMKVLKEMDLKLDDEEEEEEEEEEETE